MAERNGFPGPTYNRVPDQDRQIVVVPLENQAWGARPVTTKVPSQNEQTIRHVKSQD
jgi:hypothetical protein